MEIELRFQAQSLSIRKLWSGTALVQELLIDPIPCEAQTPTGATQTNMPTKDLIERGLEKIQQQYGQWSFDIPLPHGVWTRGNQEIPHTRLKRILQVAHDLCTKPLGHCRVLDLGCLDGLFAIEFALHGADTVNQCNHFFGFFPFFR